jgi:DNA-binding SARP family transcriptional activator
MSDREALVFSLLGPLTVRVGTQEVPLPPGRPRELLTALLLGRGGPLSADRLVDALWDDPPASAGPNLRKYVGQLRKVLGTHRDRLVHTGTGYALLVRPGELDLQAWEAALAQGREYVRSGRVAESADHLAAALTRWSGTAAEGIARRGPVGRALDTLDEGRCSAIERLAQACLDTGQQQRAVEWLRPLLAEQPTRETAWCHLMRALACSGDRGGALEAYAAARRALVAELGIEPGVKLRELHLSLLRGEPAGAVSAVPAPPLCTLPPAPDLIGRDDLVTMVVDRLREPGTVALHGPAGVGKSVLAVRAAGALAARYPGGQLYLDMCGSSPGLTPMSIGEALGALLRMLGARAATGSITEDLASLNAAVAGRRVLVVLDNVVDAGQVRRLLTGLTGTAVLLTSRSMLSSLDVREQVPVEQLAAEAAAGLLARYAGPDRVSGFPGDTRVLAALCGHLPLALRIAGARLASRPDWSLAAMVARLTDERHRLDELAVDDLEVRSALALTCRTLADRPGGSAALALFDSWGACAVPVLRPSLAQVLSGGPDHEARAALDRLAHVRLIEPVGDGYRLHDLIRVYALERGRRLPPARRSHLRDRTHRYFVATARRARDRLRVNDHPPVDDFAEETPTVPIADEHAALAWYEAERVNLVDAVRRAARTERGALFAVRLTAELYPFLPMRGYYADWAELAEAGLAAARRFGSVRDEAEMLVQLGGARTRAGRHRESADALRTALALSEELGSPRMIAVALDHLGISLAFGGELAEAKAFLTRCVDVHRASGANHRLGVTLNNLSDVLLQLGDTRTALVHLQESLALRRELDDRLGLGITTLTIAQVHARNGSSGEALRWLAKALAAARDSGNHEAERTALITRAGLYRDAGDAERARQDLTAALALAEHARDEVGIAELTMALHQLGNHSDWLESFGAKPSEHS